MAFAGGTGFGNPIRAIRSLATAALSLVATSSFQAGLSLQLARGGDIVVDADSIFSGKGDDWNNSVENRLRDAFVSSFQNAGWESGWGYFPAGDQWSAGTNTPSYFHKGTFTGTPQSQNYTQGVTARSSGANSWCRFSLPAVMSSGRNSYPIKKIELIVSAIGESTAPSLTVDIYATAAPLASSAANISPGTASSVTYNGLSGQTVTVSPGNITNGAEYRTGLFPITFDGSTHCPVVQVTTSTDCEVVGVILYNNDWDYEGKGIRFHGRCISGSQLLPSRSTQTSGSPDWTTNNNQGFMARYRSWQNAYGFAGTSNTFTVSGPSCNAKLIILEKGINDELLNTSSPSAFGSYYMDTVDAIMNANPQTYMILVQPYCPGSLGSPWRKGFDSGLSGNKLSPAVNWTSYFSVLYACQAKYPTRIAVVSLDRLLGETDYSTALQPTWQQSDQIHWQAGGPAWAVAQIMSVTGAKGSFPLSTGLSSSTPWSAASNAIRFDRYKSQQNYGSSGNQVVYEGTTASLGLLPQRSSDNRGVVFNINYSGDGYGYKFNSNVVNPQSDFSILLRFFLASSPSSSYAYIASLYGDEGGVGLNWQIRLGDGSSSNALKVSISGASLSSGSVIAGQINTVIVRVSGSTASYRINGSSAGTSTFTPPGNTPSSRKIGTVTGPGRPLPPGSIFYDAVEIPSSISNSDCTAWETNPDIAYQLS